MEVLCRACTTDTRSPRTRSTQPPCTLVARSSGPAPGAAERLLPSWRVSLASASAELHITPGRTAWRSAAKTGVDDASSRMPAGARRIGVPFVYGPLHRRTRGIAGQRARVIAVPGRVVKGLRSRRPRREAGFPSKSASSYGHFEERQRWPTRSGRRNASLCRDLGFANGLPLDWCSVTEHGKIP